MEFKKIDTNKKQYINLLLLADEQENMIDLYLNRGTMYVLNDFGVKALCVVTDEDHDILEIKNIAVEPDYQNRGYGTALIDFIIKKYKHKYRILQVGTGDVPKAINFYKKSGFHQSHKIKNFFTDHYDEPIYDDGIQLVDMIYLQVNL